MFFKFQTDTFSQAGKSLAKGSFITGLMLIGFGMLVFWARDIFAAIAAVIFFMAGFSAIGYAIRMFMASRKMGQQGKDGQTVYRENVEVHYHDDDTNGL